jgi:glycosyltransferase involved in cell wall biosynthesis
MTLAHCEPIQNKTEYFLVVSGQPDDVSGGNIYNSQLISSLGKQGIKLRIKSFEFEESLTLWMSEINTEVVLIVDSIFALQFCEVLKKQQRRFQFVYLCHLPIGMRVLGEEQKNDSDEIYLLENASFTITTSEFTKKWLLKYPVKADIFVLLPKINFANRKLANIDPPIIRWVDNTSLRILCVANFLPAKGQLELLYLLNEFKQENWQLMFVSGSKFIDKRYFAQIEQKLETMPTEKKVHIYFDMQGSALQEIYQSADVFVSLTKFETYGMALAEARACALPVVVNDVGGVRESTSETSTIYLNNERKDFISCLCNFFARQEYVLMMKANAKRYLINNERVKQEHNMAEIILSEKLKCLV